MSKPKEKPKKIDPKELEAQRLISEARRKEEEERKRLEEQRRYEIILLPTGLPLILTEYCIFEAWKNPKPKDFFIDFMLRYFKREGLLENFENLEVNIIAEFHLFNLIFIKEELYLDDYRATVLMNLFWQLLINNNTNYSPKVESINPVAHKSKRSSVLFKTKTIEGDLSYFESLLLRHTVKIGENPCIKLFTWNQSKRVLEFVKKGYFQHYKLYQNIFNNKQKNEEIQLLVQVDLPLYIPPLSQALYMGKDRIEVKDEEEEYNKEILEKLLKAEKAENERLEVIRKGVLKEKEENSIDYKTLKLIEERIKKEESGFEKSRKDNDLDLEKKIEGIINPKKK